jgi:hypothetical protein
VLAADAPAGASAPPATAAAAAAALVSMGGGADIFARGGCAARSAAAAAAAAAARPPPAVTRRASNRLVVGQTAAFAMRRVLCAMLVATLSRPLLGSVLLANLNFPPSVPPINNGGLQVTDRLPYGGEARSHGLLLRTGSVATALTAVTLRAQCLNGNAVVLVLGVSELADAGGAPGAQAPPPAPAGVQALWYSGTCVHAVSPDTYSLITLTARDGDAPLWLAADAWHALNVSCASGCSAYSTGDEAYCGWLTLQGTDATYGWTADSDAGWVAWGNLAFGTASSVFWMEIQGSLSATPQPSPMTAASASPADAGGGGGGGGTSAAAGVLPTLSAGAAAAIAVGVVAAVAAAALVGVRARARARQRVAASRRSAAAHRSRPRASAVFAAAPRAAADASGFDKGADLSEGYSSSFGQ